MRRRSLAVVLAVLTVVLVAVVYRLQVATRPSRPKNVTARLIPPLAMLSAPARLNVFVSTSEGGTGDSLHAILVRDFENSDWLRVVSPDSAAIAVGVRATLTVDGVHVRLIDGATGAVLRVGDFALPSVAPADSLAVADSLARDLATKDAVTRSLIARNGALADSLRAAQAASGPRRKSSFWLPAPLRHIVRATASRDSLLRLLAHANADIRARAQRDTANYRSAQALIGARADMQRDSLTNAWRWAVHGIADQLTAWIGGHRGVAQSRIAYIARGQLRIVDADGANDHVVAKGGVIMSPAWRHDGAEIAFSQLNDAGTQIAQLDLKTSAVNFLSSVPRGLNITPVYSPDDRWIVFARGGDRGTDIVAVPRLGGALRRIVSGGYDNSGPVFDPGGDRIAFSSARSRTPEIYSVRLDGRDERLETPALRKGRTYRSSPDWSPDGRAIAFEQQNGNFQVWMVDVTTRALRKLTSTGENEGPSWAPDARHLVFTSTQHGIKNLWIMDVASGRVRQLTHNGEARLAAWSPAGPRVLAGAESLRM